MSSLERILDIVAQKVTPAESERRRVACAAESLRERVSSSARAHDLDVEVRIDGSVAKDTWISQEADIDVFMMVPPTVTRADLEARCLNIVREAAGEYTERFAEHPYVETHVDGIKANIVPCYRVEMGQWKSATDRTPYHTLYMQKKMDSGLRREVRLTKKFAKGIGIYGAEIRTSGFSGMLCEVLTLNYNTFVNLVSSARSWTIGQTVDVEGYYKKNKDLRDLFPTSLIVVDPVDRGRNVAAAVNEDNMWKFVAASRRFLEKPSERFFFPPPPIALSTSQIKQRLSWRNRDLIFVQFGLVDAVVDTLWSQLYKTERALNNLLRTHGFTVTRSMSWSNEKNRSIITIELEQNNLPGAYKHLGPPVSREEESQRFLEKHLTSDDTIAGPRVEKDRWVVDKSRSPTAATELLEIKMRNGGRDIGIAAKVASSTRNGFDILVNDKIVKIYEEDGDFATALTEFLRGRPFWLE